jgi:hypothetical protein
MPSQVLLLFDKGRPFGDLMVLYYVPVIVMDNHAFSRTARIIDRHAAMDQVGMPDQQVSFAGQKDPPFQILLGDQCCDPFLIVRVLFFTQRECRLTIIEIIIQQIGQAVAARIVEERAIIRRGILQGDPNGDQIAEWIGGHVNTVGVSPLIAAPDEIDRLERYNLLVQDEAEQIGQAFIVRDIPDAWR